MKASDLIEHLKNAPPDDHVYIWLGGNRYAITDIHFDLGDNYIDLNAQLLWGEEA